MLVQYLVVCLTSFTVSALTLFSGFGLGTLLLPVFSIFFPVPVAVAATAVVHFANNIFKALAVGDRAHWGIVAQFALPGAAAALLGAGLLTYFAALPPAFAYMFGLQKVTVSVIDLIIGVLIIGFGLFEILPKLQRLSFDPRWLPVGGLLSGFFGGLSGNHGALRAAFLIKTGLSKDAFIATSVMSALVVDAARLMVYGTAYMTTRFAAIPASGVPLLFSAILSSLLGVILAARHMNKVTLPTIRYLVGGLLLIVGLGLISGLI